MTISITSLAVLMMAVYGAQLARAIQCDPANYVAVEGTAATDEWCQLNCNFTPRFCPNGFCQCAEGAAVVDPSDEQFEQLPPEECPTNDYQNQIEFPVAFCNTTCNQPEGWRSCPREYCACVTDVAPSPSPIASAEPTPFPTAEPSVLPTAEPSVLPTAEPSVLPTAEPSVLPTAEPSVLPSVEPSPVPPPGGVGEVIPEDCVDFFPAAKAGVDQIICTPGVYVASANYSDLPGMDLFCTQNCRLSVNRFCPTTHCACGADAEEMTQQPSRLNQLTFDNRTCLLYGSLAPEVVSDRFCHRTCMLNPELCFDALCECLLLEGDEEAPQPIGRNCTVQLVCEDIAGTETDTGGGAEDEGNGLTTRLRRLFHLRG